MKTYWGWGGGILHSFITLALDVECSISPWPLHPHEKNLQYPLNKRLGGPQSQSGYFGEKKSLLPLPGIKTTSSIL